MRLVSMVVILFGGISLGVVKETNSMTEALSGVDSGTLVIFDIDNTIIETVQTVASDQWEEYLHKKYRQELEKTGMSPQAAEKTSKQRSFSEWKQAQKLTEVKPVEPTTPDLIGRLQKKGITVMGLTARPVDMSPTTLKQLASVQVDMGRTGIHKSDVKVDDADEVDFRSQYVGGILFVGHQKKGPTLVKFLMDKIHYSPKRIVFIDDKKRNVDSVEQALVDLKKRIPGLEHISYRYGAADATVAAFRPDIAELQFKHISNLLSDPEAQALLAAKSR